jgi:periplasmic protein TonB
MKKFLTVFVALIFTHIAYVQAQAPDSAFDDLSLNGMASYEQLRKDYYIGALYLETISQDTGSILNMSGRKRMELRITISKWSRRRFAQQWNQSILINNDQDALEEFSDQILEFTNIPRKDLEANDRIVIDMDPETGTTVYLNRQKMLTTPNNAFFDVLLNTWIGPRPPSSGFKSTILTLPTNQLGTDLLTDYDAIETTKTRESEIASWLKAAKKEKESQTQVAERDDDAKSRRSGPPGSGTKVTAKRVRKSTPTPKLPTVAAVPAAAVAVAPKPTIALAKPTLGSSNTATAKPAVLRSEPKSKPKPKLVVATKLKPAPPKVEKPAKKLPSAKELAQGNLIKNYRSNVLKLTYLNTQYPRRAMDLKQEGLVVLKVTLNRKGKLVDMVPETSSKHNLLNKAARNAVKKSAPFPEPPKDLEGSKIELTLPFNFKL